MANLPIADLWFILSVDDEMRNAKDIYRGQGDET